MEKISSEGIKKLRSTRKVALGIGASGIIISAICYFFDPKSFFPAYLVAFMLCLGVTLGPVGLGLLHNLVGGRWGRAMNDIMRVCAKLIPLLAILFLPLLFGLEDLYPWAREKLVAASEHLQHKTWYLDKSDFVIRAVIFFFIWVLFALSLQKRNKPTKQSTSAIGLVLYVLAITFSSIDWVMSLEPLFYSTIFGLIVLAGLIGSTFAFVILIATFVPTIISLEEEHVAHDFGNFLLMSVMLWAYFSFSQLLLIWSGQLPEEIMFYNYRFVGGWQWLGIGLIVFHFFLPFFLLLSRKFKRNLSYLAQIAGLLLFARWMDWVWLVQPNFSPANMVVPTLMFVLPITLGAIWLGAFLLLAERLSYDRNT